MRTDRNKDGRTDIQTDRYDEANSRIWQFSEIASYLSLFQNFQYVGDFFLIGHVSLNLSQDNEIFGPVSGDCYSKKGMYLFPRLIPDTCWFYEAIANHYKPKTVHVRK
jgi:hypothetical protein